MREGVSGRSAGSTVVRAMFRRQGRVLVAAYLLRILHQVCEALVPVAIGLVIGTAVSTGDVGSILWGVGGILGLFTVLAVAGAVGYYLTGKLATVEAHRLRVAAARRMLVDRSAPGDRRAGELLSITTSDARATTAAIETIGALIASSVGLAVAAVTLLRIDTGLGLAVLGALALVVTVTQLLGPYLARRLGERQQATGLAAAVATDLLTGLRSLRGFGGVGQAVLRYRGASRTSLTATARAATSTALVTSVGAVASGILVVVTAVVAARYAVDGRISIADLVTVIGLASFLLDPLTHLTVAVRDLAVTRASSRRVAELVLGAPPAATDAPVPAAGSAYRLVGVGDATTPPLDLDVAPGETLGVVAADLATASRFADVLSGAARPVRGRVLWGGSDLADLPEATRDAVVLAEPHAVHLLGGSLAAALDTGRPPDDAALDRALAAASVRIADLAARPDARPGDLALLDHGANLSGGQRQRISLARALYADRELLILRDPTSAVDAVTEDEIADGVRGLRSGRRRTVLFTSSPLLLSRCDRVVFAAADGSWAVGTHRELGESPDYRAVVLR